ncbi:unnamed protein product [Paramecium pentaurelia]|uniref:Phospholipid-transporting ATPase n=1 Tax=Paramecium pentaurelia TaxID=43138 RepID=A0A8S1UIC9_9CILI|nr:unnamed protein product [Paramecium pentaurelia]
MFWQQRPVTYNNQRTFESNFYFVQQDVPQFPSNFIKTSRYNLVTFLPFSLLLQFTRYANIYFLCIAIIQCIPILSTLNPFSAIAPLVFVLGLSMCREGWEDYGRHVSDNEVNSTECFVLKDRRVTKTTWAEIQVGDYVYVRQDESFPADLIVLGSEKDSGACYIETSSLDGEKNLKPKSAILDSQQMYKSLDTFNDQIIKVVAESPSQSLYEFDAQLFLPINSEFKKFQLNAKQLLLRGAQLRNTNWIIGIVVYTGQDSKIMRNADASRVKSSEIETTMNVLILGILCVQITLSIISCSFSSVWLTKFGVDSFYLDYTNDSLNPSLLSFYVFFSYILLYNTMIPISLIVSLEFVKVFQSYFMEMDVEMYVQQRNKFCKVQTTTINEELGQVEYIFSDKTGTLTCNQMEFKYSVIGNFLYGKENQSQTTKTEIALQNILPLQNKLQIHPMEGIQSHSLTNFNFYDEELINIIDGKNSKTTASVNLVLKSKDNKSQITINNQKELVDYYFFLLSSAHECIIQYDQDKNTSYQGPSPDEITLVDAAARMGYKFTGASASEQNFMILNQPRKVKLLKSFEFDSNRKRMSVIIQDEKGIIKLLIKGADSIIKSRLSKEQKFLDKTIEWLEDFSRIGLRCLLMATRILSEDEYKKFDNEYNNLPDGEQRAIELNRITDELERDLTLIGATAVEDKLQSQVPETIADLLKANIKVWMLTGDKLETAENIAKSCKLIQGDFTVMRLSESNEQDCMDKLKDIQDTYDLCIKENRKKSIVIEGQSLDFILNSDQMASSFVQMAKDCESIVCCRVTPKQKADVVRLIKNRLNKITLAIGDGANDVNMIQAAHIGVGLYGNEGMRAVQSADFALGEFQCLWRLLLVHGHWNYIRISEMILYFFYKNMLFTIPQFFFSFFCAFSAQSFYDDWYITLYNLIFTALPLIIRATFDQDINYKQYLNYDANQRIKNVQLKQENYLKQKFPYLYYVGQKKTIFTIPSYMMWAFTGILHGMIIFFFLFWIMDYEALNIDGYTGGLAPYSLTVYTAIILVADLQIIIQTKYWTLFNVVAVSFLSLFLYGGYVIISHYWPGELMMYTPLTILKMPSFWLCQFLILVIVGALEAFRAEFNRQYFLETADEILVKTKQFTWTLNEWLSKQKKVARQDSFWAEIYKEDEQEQVIQFEETIKDANQIPNQ